MKLRHQLFIMSLLLLSLPWAGCQYLQAVDLTLRDFQESSLVSHAESLADRLMTNPALLTEPHVNAKAFELALYASAFNSRPIMDGYQDDWRHYRAPLKQFEKGALSISLKAATYKEQAYFFIEVVDSALSYFNPSQAQSLMADHIVLTLHSNREQTKKLYLYASAPGQMSVGYRDANQRLRPYNQVKAIWRENKTGYQLELEIDKAALLDGFDIDVVDFRDELATPIPLSQSDISGEPFKHLALVSFSEDMAAALQSVSLPDTAAYILNAERYIVASQKAAFISPRSKDTPWFIEFLYRKSLSLDAMPPRSDFYKTAYWSMPSELWRNEKGLGVVWYRIQDQRLGGKIALNVIVPLKYEGVVKGFLLLEKTADSLVALTNSAFNRLFLYTLSVFLLVAIGLIAYASWLSWRVSRLNKVGDKVMTERGLLSISEQDWPDLKAGDELGDLSRSYRQLLLKVRESQEYLRGLSNKLSHELRTPIAIVRSSLDNIAEVSEPALQQQYKERAQAGIERLSYILNTMSAANRIEESMLGAEFTSTELNVFLASVSDVYRDIYPKNEIQFIDEASSIVLPLSQELFVQMLDKLIDNASDFSSIEDPIIIRLKKGEGAVVIQVENKGPLLPESMEGRLFESMVSLRADKGNNESVHLGLGLYVVRLIAQLHKGQVFAQNDNGNGVIFSVSLPM